MICTVAMVVLNIAAANTSFAHGEKVCIQQPVKLVNFLADNRIKKAERERLKEERDRLENIKKIRNQKIKGNG
jgi:hypothetical protein